MGHFDSQTLTILWLCYGKKQSFLETDWLPRFMDNCVVIIQKTIKKALKSDYGIFRKISPKVFL